MSIIERLFFATAHLEKSSVLVAVVTTTISALVAVNLGASFINRNGAALEIRAVERCHRAVSFRIITHFNEAEAFARAAVPVCNNSRRVNRTVLGKKSFKGIIGSIIR